MVVVKRTSRTSLPVVLATLILFIQNGKSSGIQDHGERFQKHLDVAKAAIQRHDFAKAQAELVECLKIRPDDANVHFLAARTARRAGDFKKAETHLKEYQRLKGLPPVRRSHEMLEFTVTA